MKINIKIVVICIIIVGIFMGGSFLLKNKDRFKEVPEKEFEQTIKKYDANQYIPVYITESDMANKYLNDFKNLLMYDIETAYELINDKYKSKKYNTYENFVKIIESEYSLAFYSLTVSEYSVISKDGYKYYYIRDSRNNLFIFKEISIMNYEVYLDDYTIVI